MKRAVLFVLLMLVGVVAFSKTVQPIDLYETGGGHYAVGSQDYEGYYGVIFAKVKGTSKMDMKIVLFKEEKDQIKYLTKLLRAEALAPDYELLEGLDVIDTTVTYESGYSCILDFIDGSKLPN